MQQKIVHWFCYEEGFLVAVFRLPREVQNTIQDFPFDESNLFNEKTYDFSPLVKGFIVYPSLPGCLKTSPKEKVPEVDL